MNDPAASQASRPAAAAPRPDASELAGELGRFKADLRAAGLKALTATSHLSGSTLFVRWLAGDYEPRGPRSSAA